MKKVFTLLMTCSALWLYGQNNLIKGSVTDTEGEPLIGATIQVQNTSTGIVTDFEGKFELKVPAPVNAQILLCSFVGYETKAIPIGKTRMFDIVLTSNTENLEEVVVVGYGSVKKSDLTGSVSSIKASELNKPGFIGLDQALAGRASGVVVTQNSGTPGAGASITIRGVSSLSGSQPLYVIDGIPLDNSSVNGLNDQGQSSDNVTPLSLINPSDVESIEILKDASATAIYGSRGANGVVLITTKSGQSGKGVLEINHETIFGSLPKYIDVLDANEFTLTRNEAMLNAGADTTRTTLLDSARAGLLTNQNWQEILYRNTISTNTNLSFSGGTKDLRYLLSANVLDAEGIVIGTDFSRVQSRLNLNANVLRNLKVGSNIAFSVANTNTQSTNTNLHANNGTNSIIKQALQYNPSTIFLEEDANNEDGTVAQITPLTFVENNDWDTKLNQFVGNMFAEYEIFKGLTFRSTVTYQNMETQQRFYQNNLASKGVNLGNNRGGWARTQDAKSLNFTNTNQFSFQKNFNRHRFNLDLGQSLEWREFQSTSTSNYGFANDLLTWYAPETATFNDPDVIRYRDSRLASFFGRVNYGFNNKLLFTFTSRYDGSSKFAKNNKWAFFPAGSLAYRISEENFIKNLNLFSAAKIRLSYGIVGNQAVSEYQSLSQLGSDQFIFGNSGSETLSPVYFTNQLPNPNLRWETTAQVNLGVDLAFMDHRLTITADYFEKNTKDLLIAGNRIPSQSGFSTFTENFGTLESKGLELDLNFMMIDKPNFSWDLGLNASKVRAVITDLAANNIQSGINFGWLGTGSQRLIIGEEVGTFFGLRRSGIAQFSDFVEFQGLTPQEQIDLYYKDRTATYTFVEGYEGGFPRAPNLHRPGEQLFTDLDGDQVITEADKQIIGNAQPDIILGFNNSFKFKAFDLSIFIDAQLGQEIANVTNWRLLSFDATQQLSIAKGAWTPENPSQIYPRFDQNNVGAQSFAFSDRFVEDGSFYRLQNLTLGYTLPGGAARKLKMSGLRIFVSGTNLHVITDYTGYNPDVNLGGNNNLSLGHDNAGYPLSRTYRVGVNVKF